MNAKNDEILTKEEVAKYLKVSTKTIERLVKRKLLAVHPIGTNVRFRMKDIEKYLDSIRKE